MNIMQVLRIGEMGPIHRASFATPYTVSSPEDYKFSAEEILSNEWEIVPPIPKQVLRSELEGAFTETIRQYSGGSYKVEEVLYKLSIELHKATRAEDTK